jgi:15-cis-phytoene synthase
VAAEPLPAPLLATRYFAALYAPPPAHELLQALAAIELEINASLRAGLEHHVAHLRLAWWREEAERCARREPTHPLTRALFAALARHGGADGARVDLAGLVEVAAWDLAAATFETRTELSAYCERWARSGTQLLTCHAPLALDAPERAAFGLDLGTVLRELQMLDELARDAVSGRLRIPLDELERAGIDPQLLARPPWPEPLCILVRSRSQVLRAELAACIARLPRAAQPPLRGLMVWAALAHRQSRRTERALPRPASPGRVRRLADAWLAWRAARRAEHSHFVLQSEELS